MKTGTKAARKRAKKDVKNSQGSWPIAYRWAAMGTLVAYSAVGSRTINVALAQDLQRPLPAGGAFEQTLGNLPVLRFDIAAGLLDTALSAFRQVTGLSVTFLKEGIGQVASPGASCWQARAWSTISTGPPR